MECLESLSINPVGIGKPTWKDMLVYHYDLHRRSINRTNGAFPYDWISIGPGYCCGPAFGHWDVVHEILDYIELMPDFACKQLVNNLYHQQPDGFLPGSVWMRTGTPDYSTQFGHPPLWIFAADDYYQLTESEDFLISVLPNLLRQIRWFENNRQAEPYGFFYLDILTNDWESGVDEGLRFNHIQTGKFACIDACSHVYAMYDHAARWLKIAGQDAESYREKAVTLSRFIRERLYSFGSGFFYDIWAVNDRNNQIRTFDGFWPLICGIATIEQATELIDNNLLNESRFLTCHPVPTVSISEPQFEQRMWRGPAWNSMTYWIARGCAMYGRYDAAKIILGKALDATSRQFVRSSTIWEFYHSEEGDQESVQRKPKSAFNTPCPDYLGHNPLFAMARLYDRIRSEAEAGMPSHYSGSMLL